jgi:hypothetical protein
MAEADDRVHDDADDDQHEVDPEHHGHELTLPLVADGFRGRSERLETLGERHRRGLLRRRGRLPVTPGEERLAEPRKCPLPLGEVARVAVEPLRRLPLTLGLPIQLALARVELLLLRRDGPFARLQHAHGRFALGDLLFAPVELSGAFVETRLRPVDVSPGGVELRRLAVELGLACEEIRLAALELGPSGLELRRAALRVRLLALEARFPPRELRFLPLLPPLDELELGEAAAQRVEAVLALPARLELPRDAADARLQPLLTLGELPLALGHLARGLAQLLLRLGEIVEGDDASLPRPLQRVPVELRQSLRRLCVRLPAHDWVVAPPLLDCGIREQNPTLR